MLELVAIARALERIAAAMELRNGALMQPQTTYVFPAPCVHDWRQSTAGWRCEKCGVLQGITFQEGATS